MDLAPYVEGWRRRAAEERERSQRDRERVLAEVRAAAPGWARKFGAKRVILFGSWAWGRVHSRSDVDLAVEGLDWRRADALGAEAERVLGRAIAREIDVRRLEDLPDWVREKIEAKGIVLYADAG